MVGSVSDRVSDEIMKIRLANGGSDQTCPTCGRSAFAPYRRIVDGRIVEGCVDAIHSDHVTPISNSGHWHNRKEAKEIRRAELTHLRDLGKSTSRGRSRKHVGVVRGAIRALRELE